MDPADAAFEGALGAQRDARRSRFDRTVALLREIGIADRRAGRGLETGDDDALGRPTIARALIAAGFATSVEDAFSRIIGHGQPGYVRREGLGPEAAIHVIRDAGGIPSLPISAKRQTPGRDRRARRRGTRRARGVLPDVSTGDRRRHGGTRQREGARHDGRKRLPRRSRSYSDTHSRLWVPPEVGDALLAAIGTP
jgi:hypothetical protein